MNIDDLLGEAYRLDQTQGHRAEAVALIREAAKEGRVGEVLHQKRDQLRELRRARQQFRGGIMLDGCHVTAVLVDLLNAAIP